MAHTDAAEAQIQLSDLQWQALNEVSTLPDSYPYSMICAYGMG
jgi:hypothetical protein